MKKYYHTVGAACLPRLNKNLVHAQAEELELAKPHIAINISYKKTLKYVKSGLLDIVFRRNRLYIERYDILKEIADDLGWSYQKVYGLRELKTGTKKPWTEKEITYLKSNYTRLGAKLSIPNRSRKSIKHKASSLKLKYIGK